MTLLYSELADWWPVLSPPADYAEEASIYRAAIDATAPGPVRSLLELGSGGGNNASHLKAHYELTLSDLSASMLAVSRALNPECEHVTGDMRTLRLGRSFDAVLIHDALAYLVDEDSLRAALSTAYEHLDAGGVALFVPDDTTETWRPETDHGGSDAGVRALRYLQWSFDPDPTDTRFTTTYAFLLREDSQPVRALSDTHELGLFPRASWLRLIEGAGFEARTLPYEHSSFAPRAGRELFLGLRS